MNKAYSTRSFILRREEISKILMTSVALHMYQNSSVGFRFSCGSGFNSGNFVVLLLFRRYQQMVFSGQSAFED